MVRQRSILAGDTDYTGVSLEDMIIHIEEWRHLTDSTIQELQLCRDQVEQNYERINNPTKVIEFIDYFKDLFTRYLIDFDRLIEDLSSEVRDQHIEIITQLYESSSYEERLCAPFARNNIGGTLKDEEMRPLLDEIYSSTRGLIINYKDLSNMRARLRTYVGMHMAPTFDSENNNDIIEIKPNFYGIGINLRNLFKKIKKWLRTSQS